MPATLFETGRDPRQFQEISLPCRFFAAKYISPAPSAVNTASAIFVGLDSALKLLNQHEQDELVDSILSIVNSFICFLHNHYQPTPSPSLASAGEKINGVPRGLVPLAGS